MPRIKEYDLKISFRTQIKLRKRNIIFFLLLSQEIGQASGGSNDLPARLAPRRTPILCRQSQKKKIIKKKGEKKYMRGD